MSLRDAERRRVAKDAVGVEDSGAAAQDREFKYHRY